MDRDAILTTITSLYIDDDLFYNNYVYIILL